MKYRILLVDDEVDILEFLSYNLIKEGFEVVTACDGRDGVAKAMEFKPHLIILDVMMPEMDGFEACKQIRSMDEIKDTLILFLTALASDNSQIEGFNIGADDYITKPIRVQVLISRIKAMLKRLDNTTTEGFILNSERHMITIDGKNIELPRKEFRLLELLYSKPQKVFTREEIYNKVWGSDVVVGDRTIDVHIRRLREKVGEKYIYTIKGVGYKFTDQ